MYKRFGPTCDDCFEPFRRSAERWRALGGVESSDPPAGTGSDIEDPAASADRVYGKIDGLCDLWNGTTDCAGDCGIFRVDDPQDPFRWKEVDVDRTRVAPFCGSYLFSRISAFW